MQITIEVPDILLNQFQTLQNPQPFLQTLLINSLESLLKQPQFDLKQHNEFDPWSNPELEMPSVDTGITDFALNHDHYLYGTEKLK
jgi:hypothetical protein